MLRSLAKRLPHPLLCRLYHHKRLREESARAVRAAALAGLPRLETLDLASLRISDALFILGSAWSINNIPAERWRIIGRHDSVGINFWPVHPFVPRFYPFEDIAYAHAIERHPVHSIEQRKAGRWRTADVAVALASGLAFYGFYR